MKPLSQLTCPAPATHFPLIDYGFHRKTLTPAAAATSSATPKPEVTPLWKTFANEVGREHWSELLVLGAVSVIAAWPVLFALHSVTRMVRGY